MEIDQKLFLNVPLNSSVPNPCSPQMPSPKWRGILIQAPKQVTFKHGKKVGEYGAFAAIPICGYYLLNVSSEPSHKPMRLFAVDKRTGKVYSGDIVELNPSPIESPPPHKPLSPEDLKGFASGGYFNPNLADYVRLPEEPAVYNIHVELREFRSNVVTIEIIEGNPKRPLTIKEFDSKFGGDNMKKKLTFEEAKTLALKLANDAFAKKKFFLSPERPLPTVKLDGLSGGKKNNNNWEFNGPNGPAGPWARVSFNIDGTNPKVEVGYSPQ